MTEPTTTIGARAETAAVQFLHSRGYDILDRNWRTPRCEIDIVAFDGASIVFCEVKYRRNRDFGGGGPTIDQRKATRLINAAELWRQAHPQYVDYPWQIDVIVVEGQSRAKIYHYPNTIQA